MAGFSRLGVTASRLLDEEEAEVWTVGSGSVWTDTRMLSRCRGCFRAGRPPRLAAAANATNTNKAKAILIFKTERVLEEQLTMSQRHKLGGKTSRLMQQDCAVKPQRYCLDMLSSSLFPHQCMWHGQFLIITHFNTTTTTLSNGAGEGGEGGGGEQGEAVGAQPYIYIYTYV